ncbi:MAG TPA: GNAT family N-acetyltransferase [Acidimicrobiaceae bacterium]|nr:GNAT family N-acetyltransferase [Acidimicrobiaceae bacterium]
MPHPAEVDPRLQAHLRSWLGAWPPTRPVHVVGSERRVEPGWDGAVRALNGVATPDGAVVSVPPDAQAKVAAAVEELEADGVDDVLAALGERLADLLDLPGARYGAGVFRWSTEPTESDDPGTWLPRDDPRVPAWLHPFNGDVLVALVDDGSAAAGIGRKQHDAHGHELAVVTEEAHRGQGFARRLVTQAARRVLADGAVPVYLHAESNVASARTADASGFPDVGWRILGLFGGAAGTP